MAQPIPNNDNDESPTQGFVMPELPDDLNPDQLRKIQNCIRQKVTEGGMKAEDARDDCLNQVMNAEQIRNTEPTEEE